MAGQTIGGKLRDLFVVTGFDIRKDPWSAHVLRIQSPKTWRQWVLWLGMRFPGQQGAHWGWQLREAYTRRATGQFWKAVEALPPGSLCIDLGANVGTITRGLAERGMRVVAFEPDPVTFARLRENVGDLPGVTLHQAAAGIAEAALPIARPKVWDEASLAGSQGCSLVYDDGHMDRDNAVVVPVMDFPAFLRGLGERVAVLKVDIEGGEWELVPALLEPEMIGSFDTLFVETHEWRDERRRPMARGWRRMGARRSHPRMRFDWV